MDDSVLEQNQRPRQRRRTSTKHRRRKRKRTSNASADGGGRRGGGGSCFTSDGKRACDDSAWRNGNIDQWDYFVDDDEVAEAALGACDAEKAQAVPQKADELLDASRKLARRRRRNTGPF